VTLFVFCLVDESPASLPGYYVFGVSRTKYLMLLMTMSLQT